MSLPKRPIILNAPPASTILTIPPLIPPLYTRGARCEVFPPLRKGHGVRHPIYTRARCEVFPPFLCKKQGVGYPIYTGGKVRYPLYTRGSCPFVANKTFFTHRQKPITEYTDYPGVFAIQTHAAADYLRRRKMFFKACAYPCRKRRAPRCRGRYANL